MYGTLVPAFRRLIMAISLQALRRMNVPKQVDRQSLPGEDLASAWKVISESNPDVPLVEIQKNPSPTTYSVTHVDGKERTVEKHETRPNLTIYTSDMHLGRTDVVGALAFRNMLAYVNGNIYPLAQGAIVVRDIGDRHDDLWRAEYMNSHCDLVDSLIAGVTSIESKDGRKGAQVVVKSNHSSAGAADIAIDGPSALIHGDGLGDYWTEKMFERMTAVVKSRHHAVSKRVPDMDHPIKDEFMPYLPGGFDRWAVNRFHLWDAAKNDSPEVETAYVKAILETLGPVLEREQDVKNIYYAHKHRTRPRHVSAVVGDQKIDMYTPAVIPARSYVFIVEAEHPTGNVDRYFVEANHKGAGLTGMPSATYRDGKLTEQKPILSAKPIHQDAKAYERFAPKLVAK